jgi:hypothetical protein
VTRDGRPRTAWRAWTDVAFRDEITAWARAAIDAAGRRVTGPIEQPHVRPWSTVFRIPTDAGPLWCKALGSGTAHEAPLLEAFTAWGIAGVPALVAVDVERAWLLLEDGGPTLRSTRPDGTGDHDLSAWERILPKYAALQRATEPHIDELLALGVPDGRPEALAPTLIGLLDADELWAQELLDEQTGDDEDRIDAEATRRRLRDLVPWVRDAATTLAGSGIAATIQHDDLHGGNILVDREHVRFFDWGDAVVAHPFGTLTVTLNSIAYRLGTEADDPVLSGVRDAYLAEWSDVRPAAELVPVLEIARDLGRIARAAAWARALEGVPRDASEGHGGAPAAWLADLVDRLATSGEPGTA